MSVTRSGKQEIRADKIKETQSAKGPRTLVWNPGVTERTGSPVDRKAKCKPEGHSGQFLNQGLWTKA